MTVASQPGHNDFQPFPPSSSPPPFFFRRVVCTHFSTHSAPFVARLRLQPPLHRRKPTVHSFPFPTRPRLSSFRPATPLILFPPTFLDYRPREKSREACYDPSCIYYSSWWSGGKKKHGRGINLTPLVYPLEKSLHINSNWGEGVSFRVLEYSFPWSLTRLALPSRPRVNLLSPRWNSISYYFRFVIPRPCTFNSRIRRFIRVARSHTDPLASHARFYSADPFVHPSTLSSYRPTPPVSAHFLHSRGRATSGRTPSQPALVTFTAPFSRRAAIALPSILKNRSRSNQFSNQFYPTV